MSNTFERQITDAEFTEAMKAAVEKRGRAYVYRGDPERTCDDDPEFDMACWYTHFDGLPGCLIGSALAELDVKLPPDEGLPAQEILSGLGLSVDVQVAAREAQVYQDTGMTWGKALDAYLAELGAA